MKLVSTQKKIFDFTKIMNFGYVKRLTEKYMEIEVIYPIYIIQNESGVINIKESRIII